MKKILIAALLALPLLSDAAPIVQTVNDGGAGWNGALWDSPAAAPSAGNDYVTVAGLGGSSDSKLGTTVSSRVRGLSSQPTFDGNALELVADTELLIKDAATYMAGITLNGGIIRLSPNSGLNATLDGTLDIAAESYLGVVQNAASALTVNSTLSGANVLHLAGGDGNGNTIIFSGDLSGFSGLLDIGGGNTTGGSQNRLVTVDFNLDYDLPNVNVAMGDHGTEDILVLDQNLKFSSFTFGGALLATGSVYTAAELNVMYGNGSQFTDGGGTLSVYTGSSPSPQLVSKSPDSGSLAKVPLALGGVLVDTASSAVDTGTVALVLDGTNLTLSAGDVVKNATTTTVSHAVSSLSTGSHTVELIYSATGSSTGPFTNQWSFTAIASGTDLVLISGTNQGYDQSLVNFLQNNFQNVFINYADYSDFAAHSNEIAQADIFMVGRSFSSTPYANPTNSAAFNALTNPVVAFSSYVARPDGGRWGWHAGGAVASDSIDGDETTVTSAGSAVLGVTAGLYDWYAGSGSFNAAGSGEVGGGELLANIGAGDIVAAHWSAGNLFGSGIDSAGGERLLFNLHQVSGGTVMPSGAGEVALIKALAAYTPLAPSAEFVVETSPSDGTDDVAVNTASISVSFTDITVDLNALVSSYEMLVNSNLVTASMSSSNGITTFTYVPSGNLAYETVYAVQLNVFRTDAVTNTVNFSFTTIPDYATGHLIAPGIRNGGFEYVNGAVSNTTTVTDFAQIDNWTKLTGGGKAGTYSSASSPEGGRYLDTDRYFKVYNLTDHVIAEGDRFDFKWTTFGRPAGVVVGLCYSNAVDGVTNIVASEVTAPDGISAETVWSGSYAFGPGDPAIGSTLGLMIQDLGNSTTNDTSTTEAHVDRVRLYFGSGPSVAPVIHLIGVDTGAGTASLMWDSESGVTYYVLSRPSLVSGSWATNLTVFGDGSTISTNVATGGGNAEFFSLEAQ